MNNVSWYFALAILTTVQLVVSASNKSQLLDTIFLRYYGKNVNEYIDAPLDEATFLLSKMENNKSTVVYIHGFSESVESKSTLAVVDAYISRDDHNVLAADYRDIGSMRYFQVAMYVPDVGIAIAAALNRMVSDGLDPQKLHIVGHSLGSQIAAYIGKNTKFMIPRITGLDPAGPLFNLNRGHLSSRDAAFVDIIHTDYGVYGAAVTTGTVDIFPNGGNRIQPGCPLFFMPYSDEDFCSHHRSWCFYAESLKNEHAFVAVKCPSKYVFVTGICNNNEKIPMGYATPNNAKGTFYLTTGADSPFGLGEDGARA